MLPEDDFGKIFAKSPGSSEGIDTEGLELILRALYGEKSIKKVCLKILL